MGKSWATGFLGAIIMGAGGIIVFLGLIALMFGGAEKLPILAVGIAILAGGSYMRYLSNQTVRNFNGDDMGEVSTNISVSLASNNTNALEAASSGEKNQIRVFSEVDRNIGNDAFKLYLVEYFKISKNEILGKYVLKEKLYPTVDEALIEAMKLYNALV